MIYINDLPDNIQSNCYMFADDTKVFKDVYTIKDMKILQQDMRELEKWSNNWLPKFHPDKYNVLAAGKRNIPQFEYTLYNTKLKYTDKEKDIGVIVDNKLNFEEHMNEKINKANSIMGLIRRTLTYPDEMIFLLLYKALVRPHLEYANMVWNPYKMKHVVALENVQRRATKQIPGFKNMSYEDRLQKLKLPTLAYWRKRGDMIETYKITSGTYDTTIPPLFQQHPDVTMETRGHS